MWIYILHQILHQHSVRIAIAENPETATRQSVVTSSKNFLLYRLDYRDRIRSGRVLFSFYFHFDRSREQHGVAQGKRFT